MSIPETGGIKAAGEVKTPPPLPSKDCVTSGTPYMNGMGTEMVDIYVGPSKVLFRLHKNKLCFRIQYFDKMFNGSFKEASSNTAYLPEDDPASFDLLADWANHPTASKTPRKIRDLVAVKDADGEDVASWDPVGFYILAEKYCLPELQDMIMDATIKYHKKMNELPSVDFVIRAYESMGAGPPLVTYCVMAMVHVIRGHALEDLWEREHLSRLYQVLPTFGEAYIRLQSSGDGPDPRLFPRCFFHTHEKGAYCAANPQVAKKRRGGKKAVQTKRLRFETSESTHASDDEVPASDHGSD